jgi:polysaccharide export outer membrane protein
MLIRSLICLAGALLLAACAHKPLPLGGAPGIQVIDATSLPVPNEAADEEGEPSYRIGAFDKLIIDVFGIEQFHREVQVDGSGDITYPLIGRVQAKGLTPIELAQEIEARLRGKYIRDPQVSVNLKETVSQVVTVDGQVKDPGLYPVLGSMTLMRAVARAGGTTEFAKLEDVVIFRTVGSKQYVALYNLGVIRRGGYEDPKIYANDIVVVGDSPGRRMFRDLMSASSLLATPLVALVNQL